MMFNPKIEILAKIRSHLNDVPREYRWESRATAWGLDRIDLYQHLAWLRSRGYIESTDGYSRWVRGLLADLEIATGQSIEVPEEYQLNLDCLTKVRSIAFVGLTVAEINRKLGTCYSEQEIQSAVRSSGGTAFHGNYYKFSSDRAECDRV